MFFQERITKIDQHDKVLEIGPGADPFPRSDVYLDKLFSEKEGFKQRGLKDEVHYEKPIYYYEREFPFKDGEFDYVICSHVLEHVHKDEIEFFISELQRVARKGYIEVPRCFYEYLFNFHEHSWLMNYSDGNLLMLDKHKVEFSNIQDAFYCWFRYGYFKKNQNFITEFADFFMIGFEWEQTIPYKFANCLNELVTQQDVDTFRNYFMNE